MSLTEILLMAVIVLLAVIVILCVRIRKSVKEIEGSITHIALELRKFLDF